MTSSYTSNQGLEKPATGDQSGTWGATVNTNMDIIDRVVSGVGALTLTGSTTTLTTTDGTLTDGMYRVLVLGDGGDLGSNNTITISPNDQDKLYLVYNNLTADRSAIFSQGSGDNATVENGETAWIYADGAGSGAAVRVGMSSTKLLDQDGDTGIRVEEGGDDDDTIRFDVAGDEDFTMTASTFTAAASSIVALDDGAVATPSLTTTGDLNTGVYFPAADTVGITAGGTEQFRFGSNPIPGGMKNMLINGAMTINQRGSTTATNNTENLDRFASTLYDTGTSAVATVTQDSDSPTGFGSSMKFDVTTIATGGGDYNYVRQRIEAQNLQHLKYGTADAVTCTFSFWFKTTITGIYSAWFVHLDASYTYIREFTVASSDTWEFFQVTLPGYTSTNFNNDTGPGLEVGITFASDSLTGTLNTWVSGGKNGGSSNQVNGLSSTSNNIYTTGWQLEVGSVATDFAHEDVGTTLQKCQRYYERVDLAQTSGEFFMNGNAYSTTFLVGVHHYRVKKRATPTVTFSAAATWRNYHENTNTVCSGIGIQSAASVNSVGVYGQVSSGLTAGNGGTLSRDATDTTFIEMSSEL
jgi:hypothetical protein